MQEVLFDQQARLKQITNDLVLVSSLGDGGGGGYSVYESFDDHKISVEYYFWGLIPLQASARISCWPSMAKEYGFFLE